MFRESGGPDLQNNSENAEKTITNQFRAGDGFNALMTGNKRGCRIVPSLDSGGHLHISITLCVPYALHMQPYAPIMHFFGSSKKPMKSSAERTSKKPYALYAPLLGVGVFLPLFLLRELHTVHTATYGFSLNRALALLPVGIEALPACENQKCIRRCIRISGQKAPIGPLSGNGRRNRRTTHSPRVGADAWSPRF